MKVDSWIPSASSLIAEELARRLSHDIRSPINSTISVLQLVIHELDGKNNEHIRELLVSLLENHRQHQWYLDALLFWTRLELGVYVPGFEAIVPERIWTSIAMHTNSMAGISPTNHDPYLFPLDWFEECLGLLQGALGYLSPTVQLSASWEFLSPHLSFSLLPVNHEDQELLLNSFPADYANPRLPAPAALGFHAATRGFKRMGMDVTRDFGRWMFHFTQEN